jgi:hypothetical protein
MNPSPFKRTAVVVVTLLCGISRAHAYTTMDNYYDLVRPNGQARSDAIFQADLDSCYSQTGSSRYRQDTPAFRKCMLGRNWQWKSVHTVHGPRRSNGDGQAPAWTYQGCVFNPADC